MDAATDTDARGNFDGDDEEEKEEDDQGESEPVDGSWPGESGAFGDAQFLLAVARR